jgi:hypothetical protein
MRERTVTRERVVGDKTRLCSRRGDHEHREIRAGDPGRFVVERSNGIATVVVSDDGVGGAQPGPGSGLIGFADRVEALGGLRHLGRPPGRGTRLSAEIPCG